MINFPNIISLARLISVPLAVWLITIERIEIAFWLFLGAGVSDAIDGFIAKHWELTSELGRILDPVADKALLVSIYVTFGIHGYLPAWIVILVVSRDALIVGAFLISLLLGHFIRVHPLIISKINTGLQIVLAAYVLAHHAFAFAPVEGIQIFTYGVAMTTVASGSQYLYRWLQELTEAE